MESTAQGGREREPRYTIFAIKRTYILHAVANAKNTGGAITRKVV